MPKPAKLQFLNGRYDDIRIIGFLDDAKSEHENRKFGIDPLKAMIPTFIDKDDIIAEV